MLPEWARGFDGDEKARWRPTQVGTAFLLMLGGLGLCGFTISYLGFFEELPEVGVQAEIIDVNEDGYGLFMRGDRTLVCGHGRLGDTILYDPNNPTICRPTYAVVGPTWYEWAAILGGLLLALVGLVYGIFGRRTPGSRSLSRPGDPLG